MKRTKGDIYGRCVPCLESLRFQLIQGKDEIELTYPLNCWKVTAVLENMEECELLLLKYSEKYPEHFVYGKYGTGRPDAPTRVVVFHTQSTEERDLISSRLKEILKEMGKEAQVEVSRGCASIHGVLFGDWKKWKRKTKVKNKKTAKKILEKLTRMLYLRGT